MRYLYLLVFFPMKIKKDEVGWLLLFIALLILFTLFYFIIFISLRVALQTGMVLCRICGFENYIKLFNKKLCKGNYKIAIGMLQRLCCAASYYHNYMSHRSGLKFLEQFFLYWLYHQQL